ncbi:zinc finger protein 790-like [Haliotis rubra]|uniref:zinc finger protein 790-like n=1 Tax=Haliotis rubra TaxID=36100 RepID=UPI001EE5B479|nr:zinc finger protein 790-like [Haliotis rubra]
MSEKQRFLDSVDSLSDLEKWAAENELINDADVNLKRIELLANNISHRENVTPSQAQHTCHTCRKTFTQKRNLLRHVRTVHNDERYNCEQCGKCYSRLDALQSHKCETTLKRKGSETATETLAKRPCLQPKSDSNIPARYAICIWCGHCKCLLPNKLFCMSCSHSGRECMSCHRPLPERFYSERVDQCDGCVRRRQRYEARQGNQTGGGQRSALEGSLRTTTITPREANNVDILQFLADEETNIVDILQDFMSEKTGMKWFLTLKLKYIKYDENNQSHLAEPVLRSTNFWVSNLSEINEQLAEAFQKLYTSSQEFQAEGSGGS